MQFKLLHSRQQWPVGHGFFHTATVKIDNSNYRYIYDCGGSNIKKINSEIGKYIKHIEQHGESKEIDMLVISHFHRDHINGLKFLFEKLTIKKLVIPYLEEDFKLVALAKLASQGLTVFQDYAELIIDPKKWVNQYNQKTEIFLVSNEPRLEAPDNRDNPNGLFLGKTSGEKIGHKPSYYIKKDNKIIWEFKFYMKNNTELYNKILSNLLSIEEAKTNIKNNLKSFKWIKNNCNTLKCIFHKDTTNQNLTSLCMYSGIIPNTHSILHYDRYKTIYKNTAQQEQEFYWYQKINWLGTGDIELKGDYKNLVDHFSEEKINTLSLFSIPHHGSKYNYDSNLSYLNCNFLIAAKTDDPYQEVVRNINISGNVIFLVTEDKNTFLTENIQLLICL